MSFLRTIGLGVSLLLQSRARSSVLTRIETADGTATDPAAVPVASGMFPEDAFTGASDAIAVTDMVVARTELVMEGRLTSTGADDRTSTDTPDSIKLSSTVGILTIVVELGRSPSASRRTLSCSKIHCSSCHNSETSAIGIATVMASALFVSICLRTALAQGGHTYVLKTSSPATVIAPPVDAQVLAFHTAMEEFHLLLYGGFDI
jgi:hypothetical protein